MVGDAPAGAALTPILAGSVLGAVFVLVARRQDAGETRMLAIGLVVAALIYVGFALPTGEPRWLLVETAGVALFGAIAWCGRASAWWLALGWIAHVGWDVGLHLDRAQPVVGVWYPLLCVGFDLTVGGALLRLGLAPRAQ
jgi:hypothetical protein